MPDTATPPLGADGFPVSNLTGLPKPAPAAPAAPETKRKARFAGDFGENVTLKFPIEFEGRTHDLIRVTPCSVGEYNAALAAGDSARLPMFRDGEGNPIPSEVMDGLSLFDSARVNKAAEAFLPGNLPGEGEPSSTQATGAASPAS